MKQAQGLTNLTSISRKWLLAMTVMVIFAIISFGVYLISTQRQRATAALQDRATRTANFLSLTIALPLWNIDANSIEAQINMIMADPEVSAVYITVSGDAEPTFKFSRDVPAINPIVRKAEIIFSRSSEKISLGTVEIVYTSELLYREIINMTILIVLLIVVIVTLMSLLSIGISWQIGHLRTDISPANSAMS